MIVSEERTESRSISGKFVSRGLGGVSKDRNGTTDDSGRFLARECKKNGTKLPSPTQNTYSKELGSYELSSFHSQDIILDMTIR